jgi:hypothetical protein
MVKSESVGSLKYVLYSGGGSFAPSFTAGSGGSIVDEFGAG